ncbi:hypothetical protein U0C82_05460 [Fulvimarina sp. 2208YS6-2-32]|uniref:PIN domain-containing protein n=1 Tax=Fulvimarina uroteuthidis TaxID=3098149 RepID=A0ABU5HZP2_9HYPH|nr:hypothetical protein [Fulvimarina sp. 2208YS6-2-32]MDY8108602.1 hypothetical protein [Fulvimarina sp. 2208YS6-2-32]
MRSAPRTLLLDTNLVVLLVVGMLGPQYIRSHKRLQRYDETDFAILKTLVAASSGLVFSPHILTETSNLLRYVDEPLRSRLSLVLMRLIDTTEERVVASRTAAQDRHFSRLGLADCVLLHLARNDAVLLTDDLPLYLAAASAGFDAQNFAHIQAARPDFN